jgi:hypothetical protein
MTAERQPLDITDDPQLSRLADDVQASRQPQLWRRHGEDVAMLIPIAHAVPTPMPPNPALDAVLARLPNNSVIARTAGIPHTDQPFPGYREEKELAEVAHAAEIVDSWER